MTDAPRVVQFGDPLAENAQERRKNSMAVALLGYGLGVPAALGILVSGGIITTYALSFAWTWPQWIVGLAVGIAATLCIAIMPVAAELNEKDHGKTMAWVVFFACLALGAIACVAYGITAPTGASASVLARPMPGDLAAMKARLAFIDIDARPEAYIIQDMECYRRRICNRRPLYGPDRLQDELEARHIEDAITELERRRPQTAQTQASTGSFLAAAYKNSANGLNWALPLLGLLICASVVAVLAGAIAPLMTGLTQNPASPMSTIAPPSALTSAAPAAMDEIQQMFDIWKERLQWGSALSTRAQVLYDDFRNTCLKAGKPCWTSSDGKTPPRFGEAMAPLLRLKRASVDTSNGTVYKGVALPGAQP